MKGEEFLSVLALKSQGETMDIKKRSTVAICVFSIGLTIPQNAWLAELLNFHI